MKLESKSFANGERIGEEFAFCKLGDPVTLSDNKNPHLKWTDVPEGTKSFVVIAHDIDVPSVGTDVNVEGKEISAELPRVDFVHWMLINIPEEQREIAEGAFSSEVTPRGKSGPEVKGSSMKQGLNGYTDWFSGDADMEGEYFGYDGPCPPWNDSIEHRYIFTVYALDVPELKVNEKFTRDELLTAIKGHLLGEASIQGRYTLNKSLL